MRRAVFAWTFIAAWAMASPTPAVGEERVLPIRGTDVLEAARNIELPPIVKHVAVSASGERIVYAEVLYRTPLKLGYGYQFSPDAQWRVWAQPTAGGRRVALSDAAARLETLLLDGRFEPRWNADGSKVAFLEQKDGELALRVYRTDRQGEAQRIVLPGTLEKGARVIEWSWQPKQGRVLLGIEPPAPPSPFLPLEDSKAASQRWTWIYSQHRRSGDYSVPVRAHKLLSIDLEDLTVREISPGDGARLERAGASHVYEPIPTDVNWHLSADGMHALLNMRDERATAVEDNYLMALLRRNDVQWRALRNARSRVLSLDTQTGDTHTLYSGEPGRVALQVLDRDRSSVAFVQSEPDLATWPMFSQWGRLHWAGADGSVLGSADDPVPLNATITAADRPGAIYVFDPNLLQLFLVKRGSAGRELLNSEGMSVSAFTASADGSVIAAIVENAHQPGQVQIWSARERKWRAVSPAPARFSNPCRSPVERLQWRSADDLYEVDGFIVKPRDFSPKRKYPLFVSLKGGNAMGTIRVQNKFHPLFGVMDIGGLPADVLTSAGYIVFLPNHRVTRYSGVRPTQAVVGQYGRHIELDVLPGIDRLIEQGWVDPARIAINGQSHGGDDVAYAISHSNRFKAAIISDSPVLLPEYYAPSSDAATLRPLDRWYGSEIMSHLIGFDVRRGGWVDPERIRTPLLLRWSAVVREGQRPQPLDLTRGWHMASDSAGAQTERIVEALTRNQVPIEVVIDRDDHTISHPEYLPEWQSRVLQWIDYYVRGLGEKPLPAMKSPIDYSSALREMEQSE